MSQDKLTTPTSESAVTKKPEAYCAFLDLDASDISTSSLSSLPSNSELEGAVSEPYIEIPILQPVINQLSQATKSRRVHVKQSVSASDVRFPSLFLSDNPSDLEEVPQSKRPITAAPEPCLPASAAIHNQWNRGPGPFGVGRTCAQLEELLTLPAIQPLDSHDVNNYISLSYLPHEFGKPPTKDILDKEKKEQ
jgi:hypothetical protein